MKKTLIAVAALAAFCAFAAPPPSYQVQSGPALTAGSQKAGTNALVATVVPVGISQRDAVLQVDMKALPQLSVTNKANVGPFGTTENNVSVMLMASYGTTGAFAQRVTGIAAFG